MMTLWCYRFTNGNVMVFRSPEGDGGQQVPELQGRYEDVRADVLNAAGPGSRFFRDVALASPHVGDEVDRRDW